MYKPGAFLISSAALTSIFSFFFGGYYRERERAYRLWLMFVAYGKKMPSDPEYSQNKIPRKFYGNQEFYSKEKDRV